MKIAVFIKRTTLHKGYSGLETQNKQLCEGLVKRGHKVVVFTPKWDLKEEILIENSVTYVFIDCVYRFLFSNVKNNWKKASIQAFFKKHNEEKFDIILGQSSAAYGVISCKNEHKLPVVSIAHGSILGEIQTFYKSFWLGHKSIKSFWLLIKNIGFTLFNFFTKQREFIHGSNKVVCVSNHVKTALIEETFAPDDKFEVIYNAIEEKNYPVVESTQQTHYKHKLVYVGQISKQKGSDILFELVQDKSFSDTQIHLIGSGDLYDYLSEHVTTRGLGDKFILHGQLAYDLTMYMVYTHGFDAFVFPTRRKEGLPMVLVEALFAGLPIIAFDNGGVPDTIIDGQTGYLVKNEDIQTFKLKLREILDNNDLHTKFTNEARHLAKDRFDLTNMIERYEKLLLEVINENTKNNI